MNRQQVNTDYRNRTRTYIEGNTVRKLEAVPQRERRHENNYEQRRKQEVRNKPQRGARLNFGYFLFLTAAVLVMVGACVLYIQLQAGVDGKMRNVAALESQIMELQIDNDATLNRIETSINMEDVKSVAMTQLGMVYPSREQIVYFEVDTTDYMNQYRDIPGK